MSTIQLDFNLPERFELDYTGADGQRHRPVMIHRALFGSIERFFGVLTEHYAGAFPLWLAPVQAVGIAVASEYEDYLNDVLQQMSERGLRVELDASDERMQKKIRNASAQKIPVQIIAGEEDRAAGAVSFRFRDGSQRNSIPVPEAIDLLVKAQNDHRQVMSAGDL
jgi:threonyl-tRNA synthetase